MDRHLRYAVVAVVATLFGCARTREPEIASQRANDALRRQHVDEMVTLILEYVDKSGGTLPFEDRAKERPFLVFIGLNEAHEDEMAEVPALKRVGRWSNAPELEAELSRVLGRRIVLPRDPQRAATFAPNVYLYFVTGRTFCSVAHLSERTEISEPYEWKGGRFHSHARCLEPPQDR